MNIDQFEDIVEEAIRELPVVFQRHIRDVVVSIEDWPDEYTLALSEVEHQEELLGFYHGVPNSEKSVSFQPALPNTIQIFRKPILRISSSHNKVKENIRQTLYHEIAHHFGIDDEQLRKQNLY